MNRSLVALTLLLALQMAPRAQLSGGATVAGAVVRAGTNEPLAGARVTLTPVNAPASASATSPVVTGASSGLPAEAALAAVTGGVAASIPPATTDESGKFVFQNLTAGLYSLQVFRDGFARQSHGQRTPGGPATAIRVVAGQSIPNIVFALVPAGNISGVIRGPEGLPQAGVPVQLLRASWNSNGQRAFQVEGAARTNDRGEYRLYWVTPGSYYVSAGSAPGPNRTSGVSGVNALVSPNEVPDRSFRLTYYPGVWDGRGAALIEVSPGGELTGIDFSVPSQQLHRIRGRVTDANTGQPPSSAGLSLAYRTLAGASGAFSAGEKYDPKTGEFELRNVPPGSYVIQAIAMDPVAVSESETLVKVAAVATRANARLPVDISDQDVDGLLLTLTPGVALPGRISIEGVNLSSIPGWERIRVPLKPALDGAFAPNLQPAAPVPQPPLADGTFVIAGVSAGEFTVGPVTGLPAGFYVKEARFSQADVLSQPLRFSGVGGGALEIVLSSRASQVDGVAVDTRSTPIAGARMVLVPDRQRNRTDLFKTTTSDSSGRFVFRSIPPGDYRVFAWETLDSYAYFDPDLLRRVEPQGTPVRVTESATNNLTVRIIPANQ
jgi:Carboxypeptidase regulatory-like domain